MKQICTFLDLLGFSNYINSNFQEGVQLIENYANILQMGLSVSDEFQSFEYFIPFSDSIFIVSSDADTYIEEVSKFMVQCFLLTSHAYSFPIDPQKPTKVVIKQVGLNPEKTDVEVKEIERNWFPTLFKGGVTFDDVEPFDQNGLYGKETYRQRNLAGKGIVKAVSLEKSGRGPRLFCDHTFIELLSEKKREKYIFGRNNTTEILWPTSIFIDSNECNIELWNGFPNLFDPAFNLWKCYEATPVGEIYFNLLRVIVVSTVRYFRSRNYEVECLEYIRNSLKMKGISHYYDSLIDSGSLS